MLSKFTLAAILVVAAEAVSQKRVKSTFGDIYEGLSEFDDSYVLNSGEEDFELLSDEEVGELLGKSKGKDLFVYGRAYDDFDSESGSFGEDTDFKDLRKEYRSDMPRYEKDTPLIQRFIDGREFVAEDVLESAEFGKREKDPREEKEEKEMREEKALKAEGPLMTKEERGLEREADRELRGEFRQVRKDYKDTRPTIADYLDEEASLYATDNEIDLGRKFFKANLWEDHELDFDTLRGDYKTGI